MYRAYQPEQDYTDFLDLPLQMYGVHWRDLLFYFYEMLHPGSLLIQIHICVPTNSHLQLEILNQQGVETSTLEKKLNKLVPNGIAERIQK
jgi:hypothetical protein